MMSHWGERNWIRERIYWWRKAEEVSRIKMSETWIKGGNFGSQA